MTTGVRPRSRLALVSALVALAVTVTACELPESDSGKLAHAPTDAPASSKPATRTSTKPSAKPSPTPAPKVTSYSGRGDKLLKLGVGDQPYALAITHRGSANFAVQALAPNGEANDLLVNEIGSYSGTVPINFDEGTTTGALKINADGAWTVKVTPLVLLRKWDGRGSLTGTGDDVFLLTDSAFGALDSAKVTHSGSANFAVHTYAKEGGSDLLVNEIGKYSGEIQVGDDTLAVVVSADGKWSFTKT